MPAGAYSKPLGAALGDRVPLKTERGHHLMIADPEVMPRIPDRRCRRQVRRDPGANGNCALPARSSSSVGCPASPSPTPEERISVWMGHRPSLPDSLPVLGRSRTTPDVVYAFGHGHVGMTAAPMTGKLGADLVGDRPPSIDIAPFAPGRFA
jgi:D-amino-acid dehydrogenase